MLAALLVMLALLDLTRVETKIDSTWVQGYKGSGVVVGIIDTGIDIRHQDFKNPDGTTRIKYVWDMTAGGTPPDGFTYGKELTASEIDAGSTWHHDYSGSGTHLAGTAAGNGSATGNGKPAYKYIGMAPEADIVAVKMTLPTDQRLIDAVTYVFNRAGSQPAVACLNYTTQYGPHDGTDFLDQSLNALTGAGRLIVAPVGNQGKDNIHAQTIINGPDSSTTIMQIPSYVFAGGESVQMECWYWTQYGISMSVVGPTGIYYGPVVYGGLGGGNTTDGNVFISTGFTGRSRKFVLTISQSNFPIAQGDWKIIMKSANTFKTVFDLYIPYYRMSIGKPNFTTNRKIEILTASPANASKVIGVGAYTVKKSWQTPSGSMLSYSTAVLHDLADFSNHGPRRDGVTKPDICASGYGLAAAKASEATMPSTFLVEDGVHIMQTGTGVAAAVVTGAIATLLDQYPNLTPDDVRNILRYRAIRDVYVDDSGWGYGKLNMLDW